MAEGDVKGYAVWHRIERAIDELHRVVPGPGELVIYPAVAGPRTVGARFSMIAGAMVILSMTVLSPTFDLVVGYRPMAPALNARWLWVVRSGRNTDYRRITDPVSVELLAEMLAYKKEGNLDFHVIGGYI